MDELLQLAADERRGSKPRCHWMTHGSPREVAARLTALAQPWASVQDSDCWMPEGFVKTAESELHSAGRLIPDDSVRSRLGEWWFAVRRGQQKAPSFDIASTCSVDGKPGLLLVEAKAHDQELRKEEAGKRLERRSSRVNHERIGSAVCAANLALRDCTGYKWNLSRDSHYQMSNRFAWACKLTELGYAVVLVYLGFLRADDVSDLGQPFASRDEWINAVIAHSEPLFPHNVWSNNHWIHGRVFVPVIRSIEVPFDRPIS
jgi:hypothetical protein